MKTDRKIKKGSESNMRVESIDLSKIEQNENSRIVYKSSDLSELMHSMKKDGQLQPIGVRPIAGGKFDCVFGNRRLVAAKKLGWTTVDANILEGVETDKDRDILNLLENLKRQNTTVSEDGRMFCVLRDYGLSIPEIATRLDISTARVETAIDVYRDVPKEFHAKIINRTSGKKLSGTISASAAHAIMGVRRSQGLNRKQIRSLFEYAKQDESSIQHIHKIGPLIRSGHSVGASIKIASKLRRVTLHLFLDEVASERLEKKYRKNLSVLLVEQIKKNPKFKLYEDELGAKHYGTKSNQNKSPSLVG